MAGQLGGELEEVKSLMTRKVNEGFSLHREVSEAEAKRQLVEHHRLADAVHATDERRNTGERTQWEWP